MQHSVFWSPGMKIDALEELVIKKAFAFYRENKTATANSLGISIRTLDNKLEKYEMSAIEETLAYESRKQDRDVQLARARGIHFDSSFIPALATVSDKTSAGLSLEPPSNPAAKPPVSVSERAEVQEVLPKHASGGGHQRRRG